jgi:hypothetical protein
VWEAVVSAGLLFRVGRIKDGRVVKGHQRWDWGRYYGHHLDDFGLRPLCVCGTFPKYSGGCLFVVM